VSFTERGGRKERVPNSTRQSQALYQAGGMTDGKIRDKPKSRPNRKSRKAANGGV